MSHIFAMVNDVAIVSVKGSDYRMHFWYIRKINAISIMKNSNSNEKSGSLWFSLLYIKNGRNNLLSKKQRKNTK